MKRRTPHAEPSALRRWLRFNFVGLIGVGVQIAALQFIMGVTAWDYRVATMMAVEIAVIHNFCWHLRYTWRERNFSTASVVLRRLIEFHATNGVVSLAGSWTLMSLLVGRARMPVVGANLITIGACSVINFLLSELVVFRMAGRRRRKPVTARRKRFQATQACLFTSRTGKFHVSTNPRAGGSHVIPKPDDLGRPRTSCDHDSRRRAAPSTICRSSIIAAGQPRERL